ncbi:UNKNOWN [Stylonychia lemnae]|uniref:Uncharacterized protein n=1 Tax=Stylonychia lemnae TaxID=5949 RepID=A0A077ZX84_STYLE|nr:UNKNOWN [Stylonychia lemnae]|eukprot:CDW74500.1 UNKNOWN [Stylonychia lemnae]
MSSFILPEANIQLQEKMKLVLQPFDADIIKVLEEVRQIMRTRPNGWIAMILTKGVEKTNSDLSNSLNTISIIAGLLLTVSFPCIISPPDKIIELDNEDWVKQCYFAGILSSIISYFLCIMLNTIMVMNISVASRDSDMIRLYMRLHRIPLIAYIIFGLGYFFLVLALGLSTYTIFGLKSAIAWTVLTGAIGGLVPFILNNGWVLHIAHVIKYWQKNNPQDFLAKMEMKINQIERESLLQMKEYQDSLLKYQDSLKKEN